MIPRPIRAITAFLSLPLGLVALAYRARAESAHTRADDARDAEACAKLDAWRRGLDLSEAQLTVERLRAERDHEAARADAAERARGDYRKFVELLGAECESKVTAARATADACYEIGWRAIVERNKARGSLDWTRDHMVHLKDERDAALARAAEQAAYEREAAVGRAHEAARARIAELEQASASVKPAAVNAVACTWCGGPATTKSYPRPGFAVDMCSRCNDDPRITSTMRIERHAARAQTVAAAVEPATPWNWCPKCKQTVDPSMGGSEWFDGSEGRCLGCRTVYCAALYKDGRWGLYEPATEDESEEGEEEDAAPTQDDRDDAAVRELLARGPATRVEVVGCLEPVDGNNRWDRSRRAILRVEPDAVGGGRYSLPTLATAPEAGK